MGTDESNLIVIRDGKEIRLRKPKVSVEIQAATLGIEAYGYTLAHSRRKGYISLVYEAIQLDTNRTVALKFPQNETFKNNTEEISAIFEAEDKALRELDHRNIVQGLGYFNHGGLPFIVMEYLPELFLDKYDKNPTVDGAYQFMMQAADAICYLHAKAMVHYDIKPVQFMLSDEGDLRLIDLGSVRHDGEEIKSGFQMTPGYIYLPAPRDGRLCFDSAADIYALGKTFASIMLRTVGMKGQEISAVMGAMTDEEEKGLTTMLSENNPKLGQMLHHYKARSDKSCLDTLKERLPGTSANKHFINEVVARCLSPTQEESEFKAPMLLKALLEYDTKRKSFLSRAQERLSKKKQIK